MALAKIFNTESDAGYPLGKGANKDASPDAVPAKIGGAIPLGGSHPYSDGNDRPPAYDWTSIVDPRRKVVSPELNAYAQLSPVELALKKAIAEGRQAHSNTDDFFDGDELDLTPKQSYERQMGLATADKVADATEQQHVHNTQMTQAQLAAHGVAAFVPHPTTGAPMAVDVNGRQVILPTSNKTVYDSAGNPIDNGSATGAGVPVADGPTSDSATPSSKPTSTSDDDSRADGGDGSEQSNPHKAVLDIYQHLRKYDDPKTQSVLQELEQVIKDKPAPAKQVELKRPNLESIGIALAAGLITPQLFGKIMSLPFEGEIAKQKRDQVAEDKRAESAFDTWKAQVGVEEHKLSAAQTADRTQFEADTNADRQNALTNEREVTREDNQQAIKSNKDADREQKREHDENVTARSNKRLKQTELYNMAYGTAAKNLDTESLATAQALYAQVAGLDDALITSKDTPFLKEIDARLAELKQKTRIAASNANVAEATEGARTDIAKGRAQHIKDINKFYPQDEADKHSRTQAFVANTASQMQSRGVRDALALKREDRIKVGTAYKTGESELKRLSKDAVDDRKMVAIWETLLNGKADASKKTIGGVNDQIAALEKKSTLTEVDKQSLKDLKTSKGDLETRISQANERIAANGVLYNETAEDVKRLRKVSSVQALGGSDDRAFEIGGYTYDLSKRYAYGHSDKESVDCSALIQQSVGHGLPRDTASQIEFMRSDKGRKAGFAEITKDAADGSVHIQPGDIVYIQSGSSPSGRHVKVYAGMAEDDTPVWVEAKGTARASDPHQRKTGVGTFKGSIANLHAIGVFRPPQK